MLIRIPKGWEIPESEATPEDVYLNRRRLLKAAGLAGMGSLLGAAEGQYPAKRNPAFTLDRPLTPEWVATGFNNYYEFHPTDKQAVKERVGKFVTSPWRIEVKGQVAKPGKIDLDDLLKQMPLEERLYRFRCVEAWSMAVPWTGFPLAELIKRVEPKPEAKYVRLVTVRRENQMPGILEAPWYPWPYFEGLRMDEAMNPMTLLVTGIYGRPLPAQNGAPIRLITPWKYGFKSIKSIVKIEFLKKQPKTFWHQTAPKEYGFFGNVNPNKPHPRWSQAVEKVLPNMERRPTLLYNGYEKWVGQMYTGEEY
ncbi:MAG: protein-methionine-sulfoxide reductase catalytic subunit MsrP [bacterium]|nr:protein-methionine-sulfoxide reductase catalytic subunit MsrP [bacterium]